MRFQGMQKDLPDQVAAGASAAQPAVKFKLVLGLLGVVLVYTAAAIGGLLNAAVGRSVTLIWAPSGIAVAALLILGLRMAPMSLASV